MTIAEIGVDQVIVDEMQEFRKLTFTTNQSTLKGVDPDGSQRAWDLYVKVRFLGSKRAPMRALIAASGTPITNTLGEMFTIQRFFQPEMLAERGIQEFDAWAAAFGETTTDLELQPSGLYKPVTRFAEFVNIPELIAMFRDFADVVLQSELRQSLKLPKIAGGQRQIVAVPASPAFKAYQRVLAQRIREIEQRQRKPQKGDDILLSVITDGRHAAIDLRFVNAEQPDEPENKLNTMIARVFEIWRKTSDRRYFRPDGAPDPIRGATQMVFSDLGTPSVAEARGFSAYLWAREKLIALGVPASEIAFMQDHKRSAAKQRLFNDMNAGKKRILIGSSETMGTGVNAHRRLVALHHLDVPWLPSQVAQREGRIERQGNQNDEIELFAYATKGSVDATGWQTLERKARFIDMAMSGDPSIRRIEDVGAQANQFGLAKAIASGDQRLIQKAGLEAEIARLERQRDNHFDEQIAIRRKIDRLGHDAEEARRRIVEIESDIGKRKPTRGDAFEMTVDGKAFRERKDAGALLLMHVRKAETEKPFRPRRIGAIGGFDLRLGRDMFGWPALLIARTVRDEALKCETDLTPLGLISRLEHALTRFEANLAEMRGVIAAGGDMGAVAPIAPRRPVRASGRARRQARRACRDQRVSRGHDRGRRPRSGRRSGLISSSINPKGNRHALRSAHARLDHACLRRRRLCPDPLGQRRTEGQIRERALDVRSPGLSAVEVSRGLLSSALEHVRAYCLLQFGRILRALFPDRRRTSSNSSSSA